MPFIISTFNLYCRYKYAFHNRGLGTLRPLSGLLAINKPANCSSSFVVSVVKRILNQGNSTGLKNKENPKVKVGHGGTLDPMATGVLILGVGQGTKLLQSFLSGSKEYRAVACLGTETDTLDCTGAVVETRECSHITTANLQSAVSHFTGSILQRPPIYSALKIDGKRMCDIAREGKEVSQKEAREVKVYSLKIISHLYDEKVAPSDITVLANNKRPTTYLPHSSDEILLPNFGLDVESSGGFYVRSLISDLAQHTGGVAHMASLIRTKQDIFRLADCLSEKDWNYDNLVKHLDQCNHMLTEEQRIQLSSENGGASSNNSRVKKGNRVWGRANNI